MRRRHVSGDDDPVLPRSISMGVLDLHRASHQSSPQVQIVALRMPELKPPARWELVPQADLERRERRQSKLPKLPSVRRVQSESALLVGARSRAAAPK